MTSVDVKIRLLNGSSEIPSYETEGAAGCDVKANLGNGSIMLEAGDRVLVPTGISIELPSGYEAQIRSRSGLCARYGVSVGQGIGTIDSDYRGEVKVILENRGLQVFEIKDGDRIAQLVIAPVTKANFVTADKLDLTKRGDGGFGSTGV